MINLSDPAPCIPKLSVADIVSDDPNGDPKQYETEFNFIQKYGRHFNPASLPPTIPAGPMKDCLANAAQLALAVSELIYVEGIGRLFCGRNFLPFYHAWCCDQKGNVLDRTWTKPERIRIEYFGVPFKTQFLKHFVQNQRNPCQLITPKCISYMESLHQREWLHPLF